ncbi:MAG TPA: histidine--tRNA ligase [Dehalococcoidia bacterium]|nr:histidine--tRNA ligase [Dehalococcoidia bacterium]
MADAKQFRAPRGVADILPEEQPYWRWVRDTAARIAESYGYQRIDTPIFEFAGVWERREAAGTDIVDKEIYRFRDRGGDELALRPDVTAGVCRAYIQHGMASRPQPVRLYYIGPVFRYDRPQAGRYRVHHQFGAEAIGDESAALDAEVIDLLRTLYDTLGLSDYLLHLNSIGDGRCRPAYIERLRAYYRDKLDRLCGDCRRRFEVNPLRLLDCKNEPCQPFKPGAPKIADYLCEACAAHFGALQSYLEALGIDFDIDHTLVRGLDYYTRTAFEFIPRGDESQQGTLGGGGRYDGLIEQLGGRPTPGVGFGTGIERIILNLKRKEVGPPPPAPPDAFIAVAAAEAQAAALRLARDLRARGATVVLGAAERSLKAQMRQADAMGARRALILGREELEGGAVTVRDLEAATQERVALGELPRLFAR